MTARQARRWSWYSQVLDATFALAGLVTIAAMVWRDNYPLNAILLVAFCGGTIGAGQLVDALTGRWNRQNGTGK